MTNILQKVLRIRGFLQSRTFAVGMLSAALAFMVFTVSEKTNAVYIRDGENVVLKFTVKKDPDDILSEYGIITMAYDSVDFTGFNGKVAEINITRAFPVRLTVDGITRSCMVTGGTVADLLSDKRVSIGEEDVVNLPTQWHLVEQDHIIVNRVQYRERVEEEVLPHGTQVTETSLLSEGKKKVLTPGQDGLKRISYVQKVVDGVIQEEKMVEETIVRQPVEEDVLLGAPERISPLEFNARMKDGKPTQYSRVIENAVATGYSARPGAGTASGRKAAVGHVAVDPRVIPYGTKLYVTSKDNQFVYGYAIAADTGTGLMEGIVDIDLFYDSYYESCLNGRRIVDIYILD